MSICDSSVARRVPADEPDKRAQLRGRLDQSTRSLPDFRRPRKWGNGDRLLGRARAVEASLSVSAMPATGYRPPGNRSGTWIAGGFRAFGFLAAGMLLATVIIQIRTDHGNVV